MFALVQQGHVVFAPRQRVGLFFSIFPDASAAARIARVAQHCRRQYGMWGRSLAASRFHVSLQHLGEFDDIPERFIDEASAAAAAVRMPPFVVRFDSIASFSGGPGHYPLVLRGEDGVAGLAMLYQALGVAMRKVGFDARLNFTPHVTLLYGNRRIGEQPIASISWTVREFALVLSLIGETKYVLQGRWRLHD
jgi:2'-5' RNA ligase